MINAANFERTILSAISFIKARIPDNILSLADRQNHISDMLRLSQISINALRTNSQGVRKLEFAKNRSHLNKVLFSQLLQNTVCSLIQQL